MTTLSEELHDPYYRALRLEVVLPYPLWHKALAMAHRQKLVSLSQLVTQLITEAVDREMTEQANRVKPEPTALSAPDESAPPAPEGEPHE